MQYLRPDISATTRSGNGAAGATAATGRRLTAETALAGATRTGGRLTAATSVDVAMTATRSTTSTMTDPPTHDRLRIAGARPAKWNPVLPRARSYSMTCRAMLRGNVTRL